MLSRLGLLAIASVMAFCFVGVMPVIADDLGNQIGFNSTTSNTNPYPSAYSDEVPRTTSLHVQFTSTPSQTFKASYRVSCSKGDADANFTTDLTVAGSGLYEAPLTLAEPDSCYLSADGYGEKPGNISITLYGTSAPAPPYFISCGTPGYAKSGVLQVHETACPMARTVTRAAVHRPVREGSFLGVRGWTCNRSRVQIRCTRSSSVIRFRGRLK